MTIYYCQSFLLDSVSGVHDFATDTIKLALFDSNAAMSSATTAYTVTNEVPTGFGYTAGGVTLSLVSTYPKIEDSAAAVRFQPATWTFLANRTFRYALMYNASKSNKAIIVLDLGIERDYRQAFAIEFPLSTNPIVRLVAPIAA